jgi:DNA-directed RNA polymerase subunit RPC12/RpoP
MKRLCAWCGQELDETARPDGRETTHGICPPCRSRHFARRTVKEGEPSSQKYLERTTLESNPEHDTDG